MLKESRTKTYETLAQSAIEMLQRMGYDDIRAEWGDLEVPTALTNQATKEQFIPDITAVKHGVKHYFEIADRPENERKLVGKWKLLSVISAMKHGGFKVLTPKGTITYTQKLLSDHNIEAPILRLN